MYNQGKRFEAINEKGEEIYVEIEKYGLTKEVEFARMQEQALAEQERQGATTDREVSDSSRNSDDSERGISDSDEDMTDN